MTVDRAVEARSRSIKRAAPGRGQATPTARRRRATLLVVEDSPTQAAWLRSALLNAGYDVLVAGDGGAALEMVRKRAPDLVLSDVDMPGIDGFELCRRLKEDPRTRGIPFVMVTQRDRVTDLVRALEVGADNYATKPLDVKVLTERVARSLEGAADQSAGAARGDWRGAGRSDETVLSLERTQVVEMLMATAQKLEEELGTVGEIGIAITTTRDLSALLREAVERVRLLSGADLVTLAMRHDDGTWQITTAAAGRRDVSDEIVDEAISDAMIPVSVDDLRARRPFQIRYDSERTPPEVRALGAKYGLADTYGWPLVVSEEVIGALGISYATHRSLTADEHRRYRHLADQTAVAIVNARLFEQERALRVQLEDAFAAEREAHKNAMFMLAAAVEARDGLTGSHLRRVQAYAEAVARELGLGPAEIEQIGYSSVMHDVGKLLVPDRILGKPGKLTEEEWVEMRRHPEHGANILTDRPFFAMAADIARCHHERWDGTGYPAGLAGEAIPLAARITSVADVFDALVTRRSYKEPWPEDRAIEEIRSLRGTSFDPAVVDAFLALWNRGEIGRIRGKLSE